MKKILLFILIVYLPFSQHEIGNYNITFQDPIRLNRDIETEIYYPAISSGNNAPSAVGQFPVIIFGHGFVIDWDAYQNIWEDLVPNGYIMVFPKTENSLLSTNHQEFGWDLQFLVSKIQEFGNTLSSPIYNNVSNNTALMGHSMGGGAAFLAADSLCLNENNQLKTLVALAPAESFSNGTSSIASSLNINVPTLIFSGSQDGVTIPIEHHIPMYESLGSNCKTFISISGGGHCYFANPNFNCDFGETLSSSGITITREEQQEITFAFLKNWLDFTLKSHCEDFVDFQSLLEISTDIMYDQFCFEEDICQECQTGDVNEDDIINIIDILNVVNVVLENEFLYCADLNEDGIINVIDIISIVNIILN